MLDILTVDQRGLTIVPGKPQAHYNDTFDVRVAHATLSPLDVGAKVKGRIQVVMTYSNKFEGVPGTTAEKEERVALVTLFSPQVCWRP